MSSFRSIYKVLFIPRIAAIAISVFIGTRLKSVIVCRRVSRVSAGGGS